MKKHLSRLSLDRLTSRPASPTEPDAEAEQARHHRCTTLLTVDAYDRTDWTFVAVFTPVAVLLAFFGMVTLNTDAPPTYSLGFFIPAALAGTMPWIPTLIDAHHARALREELARQEGTEVPKVGAALIFPPDEATVQAALALDQTLDDATLALVRGATLYPWRVSQVRLAHARAHAFLLALGRLPKDHPLVQELLATNWERRLPCVNAPMMDAVIEAGLKLVSHESPSKVT